MTAHTPVDVTAFWDDVDHQLATVAHAVQVTHDARPRVDGVRIHRVTFHSLDDVRVGAWLAVPDRDGPHPGLVIFPGYKSDPLPAISWARRGYAAFSVAHRAKLGATDAFNPGYPGVLTHGITDPATYAYRGIYADCFRAVEVATTLAEIAGPLALYGYSQGGPLALFAAARRPDAVGAVAAGAPFLTAFSYSAVAARTYPYFEIPEYLANHPDARDAAFGTLEYFDALHAIGEVRAPLMLFRAGADEVCPPYSTTLLRARAPQHTRWFEYDESGHEGTGARANADVVAFYRDVLGAPEAVADLPASTTVTWPNTAPELPELIRQAHVPAAASDVSRTDLSLLRPATASTTFANVKTSDGATAGAYVSIPTATASADCGVIVEFTPYASVVTLAHPEDRERARLITLAHRGQRAATFGEPWMLPGVFDRSDAPSDRFTQLVADNMQVLQTLLPDVQVPGRPVIGIGPDWLLPIAALTGVFTHIEVDSFWLTGVGDGPELEYPRREIVEQLTDRPDVFDTIAWCDSAYWASQIPCDLLVVCGDTALARRRAERLTTAHRGSHAIHIADVRSAREAEWRHQRRAELLGTTAALRWQTARSGVRL